MSSHAEPRTAVAATGRAAVAAPAAIAILLGLFLVWGMGFAQPNALHNAAHDSRHSFAFACH